MAQAARQHAGRGRRAARRDRLHGSVHRGIARVYDLEGNEATIIEKPLETPLLDPLDVILIFGALGRAALRGLFRLGLDAAGETTAASAIATASCRFGPMLRLMFRSSVSGDLRFAAKPLARMSEPGRFVPASILKLAIRHGVRDADPQSVAGVCRYFIDMFRASKSFREPAKAFTLRVILREADRTVLHFHYE